MIHGSCIFNELQ
ncbi:hypothetical protein ABFA07_003413 [Porites harrisoni]